MTDISKCAGKNCTLKESCWRYKAPSNDKWQAYASFEQKDDKTCDYYWEIKKEK